MQATETEGRAVRDQLGQRERASGLTCPWCHGGRTAERSLLAWLDGLTLRAKCKRAKCGRYGSWDALDLGMPALPPSQTPQAGKRYVVNTLPLAYATVAALQARYRLQAGTLSRYGLRQNAAGTACYCPVYGPTGQSRGWVRRWLDGTIPKVKGYPSWDHPANAAWQAWFACRPMSLAERCERQPGNPQTPGLSAGHSKLVVCVEDVFSAMRLWEQGISAVALLGVSLSAVKVAEMRRFASPIVVALDADAFGIAIAGGLRQNVQVRFIEPDIKDMTEEQLDQWTTALHSSLHVSAPGMPATS